MCQELYVNIPFLYCSSVSTKKEILFLFFLENVGIKGVDMLYENAEV